MQFVKTIYIVFFSFPLLAVSPSLSLTDATGLPPRAFICWSALTIFLLTLEVIV
jgi:hypothetical protein